MKKKNSKIKINFFKRTWCNQKPLKSRIIQVNTFMLSPGDEINNEFVNDVKIHIKENVSVVMCSTKLKYAPKKPNRLINFVDSKTLII